MYFAEHLHAIHRKDLFIEGLEAIWLQVKTSSTLALFSVIYRPPDDNLFFERINTPLEKAWLRSENIFLLGDFNCDFSFQGDPDNILHRNTIKLRSIFESFNMHNMTQEATRSTISSISLSQQKGISSALLEYSHWGYQTTKRDLISSSGVFPLGLSNNKKGSHQLFWSIPTGAIRSCLNLCNHSAQEQKTITKNHQNKKLQKNGRREI